MLIKSLWVMAAKIAHSVFVLSRQPVVCSCRREGRGGGVLMRSPKVDVDGGVSALEVHDVFK